MPATRSDPPDHARPADPAEAFATTPVPASARTGWLRVAVVSAMVAFSLPTFVTGVEVLRATGPDVGAMAVAVGCALLTLIAALCGAIGARTHLSSYMLARIAFGERGAALVNLAFALSLLGWFGVNIDLFSAAIARLLADTTAATLPLWSIELLAGAVMTVTTLYGFASINRLALLLVPAMMLVTAMLANAVLTGDAAATGASAATATLSFGDAVSAVVGGVIIGAVILPDITRFLRDWRGAIYTALLSYLLVQVVVMVTGGLAAVQLDNDDFLDLLLTIGLGWGAFVLIIAGSWILNALNLYSTVLSLEATWPAASNRLLILLMGAAGTAAAFANILDYFLNFLFYLAIVFVPVAGVIIVDYLVARPQAYGAIVGHRFANNPAALIAWGIGCVLALLGAEGVIRLSGIAAVDAMIASGALYLVLERVLRRSAEAP